MSADTLHVVPMRDLVEHVTNDDCVCGPTTQPVEREDGSYGWVMVHHSLDGRETREPSKRDLTARVRRMWRRLPHAGQRTVRHIGRSQ